MSNSYRQSAVIVRIEARHIRASRVADHQHGQASLAELCHYSIDPAPDDDGAIHLPGVNDVRQF